MTIIDELVEDVITFFKFELIDSVTCCHVKLAIDKRIENLSDIDGFAQTYLVITPMIRAINIDIAFKKVSDLQYHTKHYSLG